MLCMTSMTTLAAADIREITIKVRSTGDLSLPDVESGSSNKYDVTEVEWNKTEDLQAGQKVRATVTITPKEGRRILLRNGAGSIHISGSGTKYFDHKRKEGNLIVIFDYTIRGDLESPGEAWWSEDDIGYAYCKKVDYAKRYQFILYKGKTKIADETTRNNYYKFRSVLAEHFYDSTEKDFYFKVRATFEDGKGKSEYVESDYFYEWEELYDYCYDHNIKVNEKKPNGNNSSSGSSCGPSYGPGYGPSGGPTYKRTGWQKEDNTWYFYNNDGTRLTGWLLNGGYWYYLSPSNGAMQKGWFQAGDGRWYYLSTNSSTGVPEGAMRKGWFQDYNGCWYYLYTQATNGIKEGQMITGQWNIGGSDYYFYSNGVMARNEQIDGWWYDDSGRGHYRR